MCTLQIILKCSFEITDIQAQSMFDSSHLKVAPYSDRMSTMQPILLLEASLILSSSHPMSYSRLFLPQAKAFL